MTTGKLTGETEPYTASSTWWDGHESTRGSLMSAEEWNSTQAARVALVFEVGLGAWRALGVNERDEAVRRLAAHPEAKAEIAREIERWAKRKAKG